MTKKNKPAEREAGEAETEKALSLISQGAHFLDQGFSVFDEDLRLVLWNRRIVEILGFEKIRMYYGMPIEELFRYNAERGEYGDGDIDALVEERLSLARKMEPHHFDRIRPDGGIVEIKGNPCPTAGSSPFTRM